MKALLLTLALTTSSAQAMTQVFCNRQIPQCDIVIQSYGEDADATKLFDAILIEPKEANGRWIKSLPLSGGEVEVTCSAQVSGSLGTCNLTLGAGPDVRFERFSAEFLVRGYEAARIAAWFKHPEASGLIYQSRDKRVTFDYGAPSASEEARITIRAKQF